MQIVKKNLLFIITMDDCHSIVVGDLESGSVYVCITVRTHVYKSIQSTNDYTCMCTSVCVFINNILLIFGLVNTDILVSSLENQTGE